MFHKAFHLPIPFESESISMFISSPLGAGEFSRKPYLEGLSLTELGDPNFPVNLSSCPCSPERLWFQGTLAPKDSRAVAVVGSRQCSESGKRRAYRLSFELAQSGVYVVSGLARGIGTNAKAFDTAAHRGALAAGLRSAVGLGRTLAVLGTGLHHIAPRENRELAREVSKSGALISQFSPGFQGYSSGANFKKRNTVIAGLSQIVVVVEAQLRSGTFDTIGKALALGRKVGLLASLVESQPWAAELAEHEQSFIVRSSACVLDVNTSGFRLGA